MDEGKSLGTSFNDFKQNLDLTNDLWSDPSKRGRFENELGTVFEKIRAFTVRETKATAGIELPEKHIQNAFVDAEPRQRELYDQFQFNVRAEVMRGGELIEDDAEDLLKRLLRLVQVASNPHLVDQGYKNTPGKASEVKVIGRGCM